MKKHILLTILAFSSTLSFAKIPDLHVGALYSGKLMKPKGIETGRTCAVTVTKSTPRPDRGFHCYDLEVLTSWDNQHLTISNSIIGARSNLRTCAAGVANYDQDNTEDNYLNYFRINDNTPVPNVLLSVNRDGTLKEMIHLRSAGLFGQKVKGFICKDLVQAQ
jgi:hypothetical protein